MSDKNGVSYRKTDPKHYLTAYEVFIGDVCVGVVWSYEGFSYYGMQGWNRGVRLRDYHPTQWRYGKTVGDFDSRLDYDKRRQAVKALLESQGI